MHTEGKETSKQGNALNFLGPRSQTHNCKYSVCLKICFVYGFTLWTDEGSRGQTARVTCNILRLCLDKIQYLHNKVISGQGQVRSSHQPPSQYFVSARLYSRKVGTATNVYTENLSSEQCTQICRVTRKYSHLEPVGGQWTFNI